MIEIIHPGEDAPFDFAALSSWWLVPALWFDGESLHAGQAIHIRDGRICAFAEASVAAASGLPVWQSQGIATPGFFDIQINGGGGVLFNAEPTVEGLRAIAEAHRRTGTTACLPTLITDRPEVLDRAAEAVIAARAQAGITCIAGIHIEGPHISLARKGAHDPSLIRPIDERTLSVLALLRSRSVPVLLTLAPECVPPGTIAEITRMGVVVSLGHTNADGETTRRAISEGASCITHLYNAMTPITSRDPGVVGAALDSEIHCGFIADGHHVDDTVLRLAIRSRPVKDRMILVSDAMPTWQGPPAFTLYGEEIRLENGRLVNRIGSLAGVHIDLAQSIRNAHKRIGVPLGEALRMATSNPARLMRLSPEIGSLGIGSQEPIVLFRL